jgi:peptidoglycan-associated lipoprotein
MQKVLVGLATALGLLTTAPAPADACSIKLIGANHAPRRAVARRVVVHTKTRVASDAMVPRQPKAAGGGSSANGTRTNAGGSAASTGTASSGTASTGTGSTGTSLSTGSHTQDETRGRTDIAPVALNEHIYFGLGSTSVSRKASVAKAVKWLGANSGSIIVEGHADPTGSAEANLVLSQHRAEAVKDAIVAEGVDAARIEVQAFGDTKLEYARTDGRNRRVIIKAKP